MTQRGNKQSFDVAQRRMTHHAPPSEETGNAPDPDALLSIGEAALEVGIYESRLDRAMTTGRLAFRRLGGNGWRFIKRSDLAAWAENLQAR